MIKYIQVGVYVYSDIMKSVYVACCARMYSYVYR